MKSMQNVNNMEFTSEHFLNIFALLMIGYILIIGVWQYLLK